jgi:hypothetical protein
MLLVMAQYGRSILVRRVLARLACNTVDIAIVFVWDLLCSTE